MKIKRNQETEHYKDLENLYEINRRSNQSQLIK